MFSILIVVVLLITLLNVNVNAFKICNTKSLIKPMMLQKNSPGSSIYQNQINEAHK
jgi:hypothetical protein